MTGRVAIYGATGFTGREIAARAVARGLDVTIAGRSRPRLAALGARLGCATRTVALEDADGLARLASTAAVLVNAAGPFTRTGEAVARACLAAGTHYLDVAGELPWFLRVHALSRAAADREVMLMPGIGFVVAPSDCLAAHVHARMPDARTLRLGFSHMDRYSRGTLRAMLALVAPEAAIRRHGALTSVPVGRLERQIDFGAGPRRSVVVGWADLLTAHESTRIPNIEVYVEADWLQRLIYQAASWTAEPLRATPWQWLSKGWLKLWPEGPEAGAGQPPPRVIVAEVEDRTWRTRTSRLTLPDGYAVTPPLAVEIVERVLAGQWRSGFGTPAQVFGPGLLDAFRDLVLEDVH